jgi:hypothetical protein
VFSIRAAKVIIFPSVELVSIINTVYSIFFGFSRQWYSLYSDMVFPLKNMWYIAGTCRNVVLHSVADPDLFYADPDPTSEKP